MTIFSLNMPLCTFVNHPLSPAGHLWGLGKDKWSVKAEAYSQGAFSLTEVWRHTHKYVNVMQNGPQRICY